MKGLTLAFLPLFILSQMALGDDKVNLMSGFPSVPDMTAYTIGLRHFQIGLWIACLLGDLVYNMIDMCAALHCAYGVDEADLHHIT